MCSNSIQYTCLLLVFVGFHKLLFIQNGDPFYYGGNRYVCRTTGTNYLGMLCSMGILYAGSLLLYRKNIKKIYVLVFTGLLIGIIVMSIIIIIA